MHMPMLQVQTIVACSSNSVFYLHAFAHPSWQQTRLDGRGVVCAPHLLHALLAFLRCGELAVPRLLPLLWEAWQSSLARGSAMHHAVIVRLQHRHSILRDQLSCPTGTRHTNLRYVWVLIPLSTGLYANIV